ncbi:MAG: amidohydrolase family protein [Maricaulaceae bacterium]
MKQLKALTAALLLSALTAPAFAADILIQNAKVVTNTSAGTSENMDVLVQGQRIVKMGSDLSTPAGAEVIDGQNTWVTPGLFAPFTRLGLVEVSAEAATNDIRADEAETSVSDLAADSFNPNATPIGNTRVSGITHILSAPDTGHNILGGIGLIANTSGDDNSVIDAEAFIYAEIGQSGARTAGGSRSAAMSQLRAALDDASAYPSRYNSPTDGDTLSRRDASALYKAVRGRLPLLIEADRASDLRLLIDLKNDYGSLDIIIIGAAEGWMVADELAKAGIKVMVDPHENLPTGFDRVGASFENVNILDAKGVDYAIMTRTADLSHNVRVITQHAGNAVGNGLSWGKAFAAISSTPARWFGLQNTLTEGGTATLVVWDGDPLELTSTPIKMIMSGKDMPLTSRQRELRDRYNPTSTDDRPHKYR